MKSKNNNERLYVHPDFKRMVKIEAAKEKTSILKLTERLARDAKRKDETRI